MPTVETPAISKAGIATSSTGERHIPSSVRPDGSVRKEIRVRPGYRPPEDVEVYKNRTAEGFRNRGKAGVPGAESVTTEEDSSKTNATTNKNAKRREARRKAAAAAAATEVTEEKEDDKAGETKAEQVTEPAAPVETSNPEVEKEKEVEKEVKKLTKKLRQARELKDKKDKGDKLLPEQFEKVIKINELIRQLEVLGFDAQGEKKKPDS